MRIISDFRDYYDSIQSQGQDLDCVYQREAHCFSVEVERGVHPSSGDLFLAGPRRWHWWTRNRKYGVSCIFVGFCGKIHLGLKLYTSRQDSAIEWKGSSYYYDIESFEEMLASRLSKEAYEAYQFPDLHSSHARKHFKIAVKHGLGDLTHRLVERYVSDFASKTAKFQHYFEKYRCPIFVISRSTSWNTDHPKATFFGGEFTEESLRGDFAVVRKGVSDIRQYKHPDVYFDRETETLEARNFYKVFDSYRAFQEIQMYLGGVLGFSNPHVPVPDDKTMRDIKGFDQFSFKKPPSKKKK